MVEQYLAKIDEMIEANFQEEVDFLARLVQIPSIALSGDEEKCQDLISSFLTTLGLRVERWVPDYQELENFKDKATGELLFAHSEVLIPDYLEKLGSCVAGHLKGYKQQGKSLLLNGHIDVVPAGDLDKWTKDPWGGEISDGALYGRGSCDQKAGVVAMLYAVKALVDAAVPLAGDVIVTTTPDEEIGGNGTLSLLQKGYLADAAIFTEPTGLDVAYAHTGVQMFRITVEGNALHPSINKGNVNAIDYIAGCVHLIRKWEKARNQRLKQEAVARNSEYRELNAAAAANFGNINGGGYNNSVAEQAVLVGSFHTLPWERLDEVKQDFCNLLTSYAREHDYKPPLIEFAQGFNGAETDKSHQLIRTMLETGEQILGKKPNLNVFTGGTDMRVLARHGKVPSIICGPGEIHLGHGPDENVNLDQLKQATRLFASFIVKWCL